MEIINATLAIATVVGQIFDSLTKYVFSNDKEESIKFNSKTYTLDEFTQYIKEEYQINFDFDSIFYGEEDKFKNIKIENQEFIESFWKENKKYKSTLLDGKQGSGKSYFAKQLGKYLSENNDDKVCYIKTWDYDYDNSPIILFLKKLSQLNVLDDISQRKLHMLIWLFHNQNNQIAAPQHLITDLAKKFIKEAEVDKKFKDKDIIFIVDELERSKPEFASEMLQIITTFTGVECSIDSHACDWDTTNGVLIINKLKTLWVFDQEVLNKHLLPGNNKIDSEMKNRFWNKYIEKTFYLQNWNIVDMKRFFEKEGIKINLHIEYLEWIKFDQKYDIFPTQLALRNWRNKIDELKKMNIYELNLGKFTFLIDTYFAEKFIYQNSENYNQSNIPLSNAKDTVTNSALKVKGNLHEILVVWNNWAGPYQ